MKPQSQLLSRRLTSLQESKVTPFQAQVLNALLQVPSGKVTTYKEISKVIDCNSSQAIGQALKRNPFAPEVPCHRVIKSDFSIGGYCGSFEKAPKKMKHLQDEGVMFYKMDDKNKWLVDPSCIYRFEDEVVTNLW